MGWSISFGSLGSGRRTGARGRYRIVPLAPGRQAGASALIGRSARKLKREDRAPGPRLDAEAAVHALRQLARDRQAEPGALRVVGGVEGLEDLRQRGARDAAAVVTHGQAGEAVVARRRDDD